MYNQMLEVTEAVWLIIITSSSCLQLVELVLTGFITSRGRLQRHTLFLIHFLKPQDASSLSTNCVISEVSRHWPRPLCLRVKGQTQRRGAVTPPLNPPPLPRPPP